MSLDESEGRLELIVNLLVEFSRGNFESQLEVSDDEDPLNTVVAGLNMLGEELAHYKKELDSKSVFLEDILSGIDEVIYAREVRHEKPEQSPFTFISRQSYEILGVSPDELAGQPDTWSKNIHPDDIGYARREAAKLFEGKPAVISYRMYNPARKQYRWIEDRLMPKKSEGDVVTQLFGSVRDVTEQITTNLELEKTNTLVSRIISSSEELFYIVLVDEENPMANKFSYISWQVKKILGLSIEEIHHSAMRWMDSVHPEDMERILAQNRSMFSTKEPALRIYRIRHGRTGEYVWLEDYVVPVVNSSGRVCELYGSARDITDRKNAEQAREALIRELSNKFNELMQFNYIVSHNLRAPVARIQGLLGLLDLDMPEDEKVRTLEYVREAADSMDDMLKDLNVILSTRSTLNEKVETISLSQLIDSVCTSLKSEIENSKADMMVTVADGADQVVSIKSYIQSALFNLIANAVKYRSKERRLAIKIDVVLAGGRTVITVADNGLGIDLSLNAGRIFGLYSRFHLDFEGKGLGLHMTKTQIESLGGSIDVQSQVGKGTTFTITL